MMVLAGLVGLRIQALYYTQSQRLSLGEVGLEGATDTGTGGPGNTVEECSCPAQYTGDSCEVRSKFTRSPLVPPSLYFSTNKRVCEVKQSKIVLNNILY